MTAILHFVPTERVFSILTPRSDEFAAAASAAVMLFSSRAQKCPRARQVTVVFTDCIDCNLQENLQVMEAERAEAVKEIRRTAHWHR